MFIEQPAVFLRWLYPTAIWRMSRKKKVVYLTFDDGPIPEATPFVLDTLDRFGIKATFFMVGDNVRKYPDIYRMVVERGHRVGNHTFNHIGGFRHSSEEYLENADKANRLLHTNLFRHLTVGCDCCNSNCCASTTASSCGIWSRATTVKG